MLLRRRQVGLTLLELMVTIAIIITLASLAVPSFISLIDRSDLKTVAATVHADLETARLSALGAGAGGNATVTITPGNDVWSYQITGDKTLTRSAGDFPSGVDLTATGFGGDNQIVITQQYFLDNDVGAISLTSRSGEHSASIVRNTAGIFTLCSSQSVIGYSACP